MSCFDFMADKDIRNRDLNWMRHAARERRKADAAAKLTTLRTEFLARYGLADVDRQGKGDAKRLQCGSVTLNAAALDTGRRGLEEALGGFPAYSARLLLRFRLLTPLLTKDDDPFYLFDNPVRKDHLLEQPHLSAAGLKGLAADAYQRAFPADRPWAELGGDDPARSRAFRAADPHARRLFGIADDGANTHPSEAGRLHFSPVWFREVQYLVMNPMNPEKAMGTLPIQFEAVAAAQEGLLEVVYFNPHGARTDKQDTDLATVRADLARWLMALAAWWPALGLGAKRLAGYGAIRCEAVELQGVDWPDLEAESQATGGAAQEPEGPQRPAYYADYLDPQGAPLDDEALEARIQAALGGRQEEIAELEHKARHSQGKTVKKLNNKIKKLKNGLKGIAEQERGKHRKVVEYWQAHGQDAGAQTADATRQRVLPIGRRVETGAESWAAMARWIAGVEA